MIKFTDHSIIFKIILLVLFLSVFVGAQKISNFNSGGTICGIILDANSGQKLEFANFILTSVKDSSVIYGCATNNGGKFILQGIPYGIYKAKISLVGYKTRTRNNIVISKKSNYLNLDTIYIISKGMVTQEVQITADKDRVLIDKDNKNIIIINPDKDWGNNALDLLENAPLVDVNFEGNSINLSGKKGTIIYIDGIPAKFAGIFSTDDLKLLSSNEIDKFELIFDPSAEYIDNEGGGIINIVTKKKKTVKYNGNTSISGNTNHDFEALLNGGFNYKYLTLRGGYSNNYSILNTYSNTTRQIETADTINQLLQNNNSKKRANANGFRINAAINLDTNSLFSLNTLYRTLYNTNDKSYDYHYSNNISSQLIDYKSSTITKSIHSFFTQGVSYNYMFKEKGRNLSAALAYSFNHMILENDINIISSFQSDDISSTNQNSANNSDKFLYWQLNYAHPLNTYLNFSVWYKGNYKTLSMLNNYNDISHNFDQFYYDLNHSISVNLKGEVYNFQYNLGTIVNNKFSTTNNHSLFGEYKSSFNSLDPSIMISRSFAQGQQLLLSFGRYTQYPLNKQLNPFVDYTDSANIITGNPKLKPFILNIYSASYSYVYSDVFFRTGLNYDIIQNQIEQISSLINSNIMGSTYDNLAAIHRYGMSLNCNAKLSDWLELSPELSFYKTEYTNSTNKNDYQWFTAIKSRYSFKTLKFQLDFNYSSPSNTAQVRSSPVYYLNLSSKLFLLNKQLALTFRAFDLFNTRNNNFDRIGKDFLIINNIKKNSRIFSLEVAYYFEKNHQDNIEDLVNPNEVPDDF
jgi:outer membrane receptor protein involved in Fe transport